MADPAGTQPESQVGHAREFLRMESEAIGAMAERLDGRFDQAVDILLATQGKVIVTGMGKAGAVGRKVSATLTSTGSPSIFLHPADAIHGDLGVVTGADTILAISNSGSSDEVSRILPAIKRVGAPLIAFTGNLGSILARNADVALDTHAVEACPHNLAPTSSTTCMLALGDALALCAMQARGFTPEDYARFHPGGALGRRLLLRVVDVMRSGDAVAIVSEDAPLLDAMFAITRANAGAACVIDAGGVLTGLVTDGDIRRRLLNGLPALQEPVAEAMTRNPITIAPSSLAAEGLHIFDARTATVSGTPRRVGDMPVVDDAGRPIGMLMLKDLLQAGLV